jgi:hypothetical protein
MRKYFTIIALLLALSLPLMAQTTTTSTTLTAAVTSSATTIRVAATTGFVVGTTSVLVDHEVMAVNGISGLNITVMRGSNGTAAQAHNTSATVYVGPTGSFVAWPNDPMGRCTSTQYSYLPLLNVRTGSTINCTNSEFVVTKRGISGILSSYLANLDLQTFSDSKPVRINSRNYTQTAGSSIAFQVKPAQTVSNTSYIIGGEISPRCNSGVACAGVIGLHVDAYLKGTAVGTISGDVRGLQIEMVTDDAGTRTVSGYVAGLRIRSAFSATAITGNFVPIRIEFPEVQTNSQTYDAALEFTGTVAGVWDDTDADSGDTEAGYLKVFVNGNARYIALYSDAP